jgi:soluble lytic murein transglycosylase-like protein
MVFMPISVSYPDVDLSQTPLQEFEDLINLYAEKYALDPLVLAALIMTESDGDPDAYNKNSMATGLGQVMPKEAGPLFEGRPTVKELKDPETNIQWTCEIFASKLHELHSVRDALFHYSGGAYWIKKYGEGVGNEKFDEIYWKRFQEKKQEVTNAGIGYKVAHFTGDATIASP